MKVVRLYDTFLERARPTMEVMILDLFEDTIADNQEDIERCTLASAVRCRLVGTIR
jgi:hypothetical protein